MATWELEAALEDNEQLRARVQQLELWRAEDCQRESNLLSTLARSQEARAAQEAKLAELERENSRREARIVWLENVIRRAGCELDRMDDDAARGESDG